MAGALSSHVLDFSYGPIWQRNAPKELRLNLQVVNVIIDRFSDARGRMSAGANRETAIHGPSPVYGLGRSPKLQEAPELQNLTIRGIAA